MGLDLLQFFFSKDFCDEFLVKIYGVQYFMGFDVREDVFFFVGIEDFYLNGYGRGMVEDYMVFDLSIIFSFQFSSSIYFFREFDVGSDEGIFFDDIDGVSDSGELVYKVEVFVFFGSLGVEVLGFFMFSSLFGSNGGVMCNICYKMYSNKGILRVYYKIVYL